MNDPNLNQLLKWSVRNSDQSRDDPTSESDPKAERDPSRGLNSEALSALMGGPSDADLMKASMAAIDSPDIDLENKLVAFDNFEQLIESIDNANNMENLGLWMPLAKHLESDQAEIRKMAAWCVSTAVQNNPRAQERVCLPQCSPLTSSSYRPQALVLNIIPRLVNLAFQDSDQVVRKKAISALSSEIRNYQPGMDEALKALSDRVSDLGAVDSGDMDFVDAVITKLREESASLED